MTAAASTGVAIPEKIAPRLTTGIKSSRNALRKAWPNSGKLNRQGAAVVAGGRRHAAQETVMAMSITPGPSPPRNIALISTWAMMA
ncbi:hypothetical protein D3C83_66650 [compost metagenome]